MKNVFKVLGIIALVAVIGFSFTACDDEMPNDDGKDNGNGSLTLTDIPATYNGKYAYFDGGGGYSITGAQSINTSTQTIILTQISNGSVSIPLWTTGNKRYSGNDTLDTSYLYIFDIAQVSFDTDPDTVAIAKRYFGFLNNSGKIVFSNGSAAKSWNDSTANWY